MRINTKRVEELKMDETLRCVAVWGRQKNMMHRMIYRERKRERKGRSKQESGKKIYVIKRSVRKRDCVCVCMSASMPLS